MSSNGTIEVDKKVIDAMETNMKAKLQYVASRCNAMETLEICSVPAVNIHRPSDTFNTAFGGAIDQKTADAVFAYYKERELPMAWWVGPNSASASTSQALTQAGFAHDELDIGMVCDLAAVPDQPAYR